MIRTDLVTLTAIPAAAYRQKLPSGGSGVVIVRRDAAQPGLASISKTSGKPIPSDNTPADLYPVEAFREAIALTAGMPYTKRGPVRLTDDGAARDAAGAEDAAAAEEETLIDSDEYRAILAVYTDKAGKFSYELLNRDLIKFAHTSSRVRAMIAEHASVETIRLYTVGAKFRNLTGNRNLTDAQVLKMASLLDDVSSKGVFRVFNDEIRQKLRAAKKK